MTREAIRGLEIEVCRLARCTIQRCPSLAFAGHADYTCYTLASVVANLLGAPDCQRRSHFSSADLGRTRRASFRTPQSN